MSLPTVVGMRADCPKCRRDFGFVVRRWKDERPQTVLLYKHKPCGAVEVEIDGPTWNLFVALQKKRRSR